MKKLSTATIFKLLACIAIIFITQVSVSSMPVDEDADPLKVEYIVPENQPEFGKVEIYYHEINNEVRLFYKCDYKYRSADRAAVVLKEYSKWIMQKKGMYKYQLLRQDEEHYVPNKSTPHQVWYIRNMRLLN